MEMIQLFLVGLCCTTLKDHLRRVVNVSAFRLVQYRKSKQKFSYLRIRARENITRNQ